MATKYLDLMFTDAVCRAQTQYYGQAGKIAGAPERDPLGQAEAEFIAARDSFYVGSISESGWPYVQHRGGPAGFLRLINETTLVFADYKGNRQLLSTGNLSVNDRVALFLMDYKNRERLKILGHARIEDARDASGTDRAVHGPEDAVERGAAGLHRCRLVRLELPEVHHAALLGRRGRRDGWSVEKAYCRAGGRASFEEIVMAFRRERKQHGQVVSITGGTDDQSFLADDFYNCPQQPVVLWSSATWSVRCWGSRGGLESRRRG